ncbi:zinc protease [Dysgonomonas sp. PH5-45]|uniref:M16 family metallopeptidase n=1 Tax=unclassified Dysgonomonas TaxID=2630389 RepID=UPI00247643FC|nr:MULTISPECIES: pitrilysin family protein [unclassified Dysgonomonas]MDH6354115.1 zinc protease [Dysgonomonas sp. PH5-45]MDH6387034.1 zinc protease [Dysgonomonas sp. PH5-37]
MKKILYIFLILALSVSAQAQIDRSIQPKAGPAPKVNLGKPQTFNLPNGLTVMVVENHKLPRVTFSLSLNNPMSVEGDIKGVESLTSSMMGNGTSKMSKDEFNNKIDFYGASVSFGIGGVSGSTLSRYFPEVLSLAAQGALDPKFTQDELDSERTKLIESLKVEEKSAQSIASKVRRTLLYGAKHPKGEYLSEASINKVTLANVQNCYKKRFVPQDAYLVIVGDVKFADVKKLITSNFSSWAKAAAPKDAFTEPVNLTKTEINFIDVPNAVQSEISLNNTISLKMTDPDFFATTLANQILGGGGDSRLFLNLREVHGWTYGAYSGISSDNRYVTDFSASVSVRNAVTDSAIVQMLAEIDTIRTFLPTQAELDLAKAKYIGNFVMNAEKPQTIAAFALREKTQNLPSDYYENYIKNINAVTLEQVQAAARKHFLKDASRIVVVGKASEVLPNLEKMNIPIKYFDRFGNPTSKPEAKTVDADVTVDAIYKKYIAAVGGEAAVKAVKSVFQTSKTTAQGMEITFVQKQTNDGKLLQEVNAMGMTVSKTMFNGTTGYMMVQGHKQDLPQEMIDEIKVSGLFPELLPISADTKVAGIENINGSDAYKIEKGKKSSYYDIASGLKVAEEATANVQGQSMTQRTYISNYKDVNGVKLPFTTTTSAMGMEMEINVVNALINEGVTDADFK